MSTHICARCQKVFEHIGNAKRCPECRCKCEKCGRPTPDRSNLCGHCRFVDGQIRRKFVTCAHPDCETVIRFDKHRTGYCAKHAVSEKQIQRIVEYNKTVKAKPAHLKYKTENIPSIPRSCIVCDRQFLATPAAVRKGGGVVCNRRCQGIRAAKLTPKRDTGIEKSIAQSLTRRSIFYQKQHPLCGVSLVDFYLPEYMVVIFCDGEYWHSSEKRKLQDAYQDKVLKDNGYNVYRFSEQEINESPDACINNITELNGEPSGQLLLPIVE